MEKDLQVLEDRKKDLLRRLSSLGDFRRGSISVNYRVCGKKNCACASDKSRRHGPQSLWNTTRKGKSLARNLRLGPELEKVSAETGNYEKFLLLIEDLVKISEEISEAKPVREIQNMEELERLKKKLQKKFKKRFEQK